MSEQEQNQFEEIYAVLVEINQEPIELYKALKIGNLVSGGGEAKQVISEGYVFLNGEEEIRKRKKVYAGDLISFNGEHLQVALKGQADLYETVEQDVIKGSANEEPAKPSKGLTKRKPISF